MESGLAIILAQPVRGFVDKQQKHSRTTIHLQNGRPLDFVSKWPRNGACLFYQADLMDVERKGVIQ